MKHEMHAVTSVEISAPYVLRLVFEDQTVQIIDFAPILNGEIFGPLRELALFNQVKLDAEAHTIIWPNGADFDPAILYNWPQFAQNFMDKARQWQCGDSRKVAEPSPVYGRST